MTWLRWDTDAPRADSIGHLSDDLGVPVPYAFGLYAGCCFGFGDHRKDGRAAAVSDTSLEQWAGWSGKRGRFAAAFRARCVDPDTGTIRGWWRQRKLMEKQEADRQRRKPPKNPQKTPTGLERNDNDNGTIRNELTVVVGESGGNSVPYLTRCVIALNRGLRANPHLTGYREISTSEQQGRVTWEAEGIPVETAAAVVERDAARFKPSPRNPQPNSLKYFDAAVHREHDLAGISGAIREDQFDAAVRALEAKHATR